MADQQKVKEIKQQFERQWLAMDGVVAVGIGKIDNQAGIIISVSKNPDKVREQFGNRVKGVPVKVQKTGEFKAQ